MTDTEYQNTMSNLFVEQTNRMNDEIGNYKYHLTTMVGVIFAAMVTLHTKSESFILEWIFVGSVIFYAVSLILLLISSIHNFVMMKALKDKIQEIAQSGTQKGGIVIADVNPHIRRCFFAGIVIFAIAIILSLIYMIMNIYV
jgi:hypothetical protein